MSSLFGRSIDYSKILGQVALNKLAPNDSLKKASEKRLAERLLELRGAPTKISQILSMKGTEEDQGLKRKALQDLPPIPLDDIKAYLTSSAPKLDSQIESISSDAQAASLGQVHKIQLRNDSQSYALKVQYPDANGIMSMDSGLFRLVTQTFDKFKEGFSLNDYQNFIKAEFQKELDYSQELKLQSRFYDYFSSHSHIIIPKPNKELSSKKHILMDFEEAQGIDEFLKKANKNQVKEARKLLTDFYLESLLLLGSIHSDPNPGNINFRINQHGETELVVYDFGSTQDIPLKQRLAILKIIENSCLNDPVLLPYFNELNFCVESLASLGNKLPAFCEVVFEPFNSIVKFDLSKWNRSERSKAILNDQRFTFMTAAPSSFLAIMRLFQGLFFYLHQLGDECFFQNILKRIKQELQQEMHSYKAPHIKYEENYNNALNLCISVKENGQEKVAVKLPRKAIENLDDFIDAELRAKIIEQRISIKEIIKTARETAYKKQDLLEITLKQKTISIKLK